MNLIDTHAHLTWDSFKEDLDAVIQRALDSQVTTVINVGADIESSIEATKIDCGPLKCFSSIGLHPHEAFKLSTSESLPAGRQGIHEHIEKLEGIHSAYQNKVVAIGECGLDYFFSGVDFTPSTLPKEKHISLQKELFLAQITLAKKLSLPLIIHCRDWNSTSSSPSALQQESGPSAWNDIFLPELEDTQGVFHSFSGSLDHAQQVLNMGYFLGFSCPVTYPKNEALREVIKYTPLEKILTETDCPFLPPQSMRGQRNEPANITEVIRVIAEVKNLKEAEVAQAVWENVQKLFFLPTDRV